MITLCSAGYLSQSEHVESNPQNKNVEKRSGKLKFKVTDLEPRLHKNN